MAEWKNLTSRARTALCDALRAGLSERGIDSQSIDLEASGLPGRYRLYIVAPEFANLDYSERLEVVNSVLEERWDRADRLRVTIVFPLSPDEVPETPSARKPA